MTNLEIKKDLGNIRVTEALDSLRYKSFKSTTLERMKLCVEANKMYEGMAQPLQLGYTLDYILERIKKPLEAHDLLVGRVTEEVPDEAGEAFFQETLKSMGARPPYMTDGGHKGYAWPKLIKLGLPGLLAIAVNELEKRKAAGERVEVLNFLEGSTLIYRSFIKYARLYGEAAHEAGLLEAAKCCFAVAEREPRNFREALQLVWLVGVVYCTVCAINPTLTFGRMDEYLYPFYEQDLKSGILTREEAGDLIEDFYCKNNLIMGRGEHQMSYAYNAFERNFTYDAPQYVTLGGMRRNGAACVNELTDIFLERIVPRFKNPVIVLRYTDDIPQHTWELACTKMSMNSSMMVYNDNINIPVYIKVGIEPEDAVTYEMFGCNHPHIPGIQCNGVGHINLVRCLMETLYSMSESENCEAYTIDDVYRFFLQKFKKDLDGELAHYRKDLAERQEKRPGTLQVDDCFLDGSIENACSWQLGSLKYDGYVLYLGFIASAVDSFASLDEAVFKSRKAGFKYFVDILKNDFVGEEILRMYCVNAPKFGQDDENADMHARKLMNLLEDVIGEEGRADKEDRISIMCSFETDTGNIWEGHNTGATPDGRHAGMPLSQNAGPAWGSSTKGLTAMFQSLAKIPKDRICAGAVNIKVNPSLVNGERNIKAFSMLLRTYFALGGLQAQLTVTDASELRSAQYEPEKYRDLMVRITGYSAAFVDMSKHAQDTIIQREEMSAE